MIKIMKYGQVPNSEIFARVVPAVNVEGIVADIIADVRANGDKAVLNYNLKFDKANLDTLLVSQEEIDEAFETVEPKFLSVLEQAAENMIAFEYDGDLYWGLGQCEDGSFVRKIYRRDIEN